MANINRRNFLAGTGAFGFAASMGALTGLSAGRAFAADTSGYKAMVCIFLKGGMDQGDTVLPYDQTSYNQLAAVREGLFGSYRVTEPDSSRNRANLLRLNPTNAASFGGRQFALPRELAPLHQMFEEQDLAIIGNVGPLIEPVTRAQFEADSVRLPARLFSHNDQQSTWMSLDVEGSRYGWGGRFMDAALASAPGDNPVFASIATGSNDVFLAGRTARQYRVTDTGAVLPALLERYWYLGYSEADNEARRRIRDFLARSQSTSRNVFEQDLAAANGRAVANAETLIEARANGITITTPFANDGVSQQLKSVAETINIQQYLNVSRQMFYVTVGGYDTHSNQSYDIARNHTALAAGLASFREAMRQIGRWDDVVVFTASDFGRTVIDNGDGTDHGWGGHHFVAGGAVRGRQIYGSMPSPETNGDQYTRDRGRLIPTVAVEQYAATIGRWFGLSGTEMLTALPNLRNFNETNLGFLAITGT